MCSSDLGEATERDTRGRVTSEGERRSGGGRGRGIVGRIELAAAGCRCRGATLAAWARTPGSSATSAATVRAHHLSSPSPPCPCCLTEFRSFLHRDTQGYAEAGQGQGDQERMEGT